MKKRRIIKVNENMYNFLKNLGMSLEKRITELTPEDLEFIEKRRKRRK